MKKKLILIELNEVNFDVVQQYVERSPDMFPAFRTIMSWEHRRTTAEEDYKHLEPWIQWVSAHTGKTFQGHGVFRLGDIAQSDHEQIFERVEARGYSVGAISPMNAKNNLAKPRYFIPDPWTQTPSDRSWWSRNIAKSLSQAVNDNANARLSVSTIAVILLALARFASFGNYKEYIRLAARALTRTWSKALFLDLFLSDLHLSLYKKTKPDFSTIFLNAGAHIQHHYFHNAKISVHPKVENPTWYCKSEYDPIEDMIIVYDIIISKILDIKDSQIIIATGLTQKPYNYVKFYYRLNNHRAFLSMLGQSFTDVIPLMTRDFVIKMDQDPASIEAMSKALSAMKTEDGVPLFGDIEERSGSIFASLTYPYEITENTFVLINGQKVSLFDKVAFVAIKNGMHDGRGFSFFSDGLAANAPAEACHIASLYDVIDNYFDIPAKSKA
ncbi:MAG: hypothetical protein IBJ12_02825 [Sphingomonadaceae bacterium]|nr:hypothetical protein [Sphingomonadaceae bacterium]